MRTNPIVGNPVTSTARPAPAATSTSPGPSRPPTAIIRSKAPSASKAANVATHAAWATALAKKVPRYPTWSAAPRSSADPPQTERARPFAMAFAKHTRSGSRWIAAWELPLGCIRIPARTSSSTTTAPQRRASLRIASRNASVGSAGSAKYPWWNGVSTIAATSPPTASTASRRLAGSL